MSTRNLIRLGFIVVLLAFIFASAGCAATGTHTGPSPSVKHPFTSMNAAMAEIDSLMGIVTALSVAVIGLGIVLMFYLKTSLGPALMAGGIGTLILSIFIKATLWFVPWIAGGVLLIGGIAFAIDVRKRGFKAALHDVQELIHPDKKGS